MARLKLHAKRELSYDPQTTGIVWTLCQKHVEQNQIAAFREGVTCRNCIKSLEWSDEHEGAWRAAREARARQAAQQALDAGREESSKEGRTINS